MGTATVCFFLLVRPSSEQLTFWLFLSIRGDCGHVLAMAWATSKDSLIEDGIRAQVYSILRIPLNVFVVVSLLFTGTEMPTGVSSLSALRSCLLQLSVLWATTLTKDAP